MFIDSFIQSVVIDYIIYLGQQVYVNKHHFSKQTKFSLLNDLTQLKNFIDQKNLI